MAAFNPILPGQNRCCCIPAYLENIIDKKVNFIALSFFEKIADWFCSIFWCGYASLSELRVGTPHAFSGTVLYDRTAARIANVAQHSLVNLITQNTSERFDVTLDGREVVFAAHPQIEGAVLECLFGRQHNTERMMVTDGDQPGIYQIIEHETTGNVKNWRISTEQEYSLQTYFIGTGFEQFFREPQGLMPIGSPKQAYLTEDCLNGIIQ